jgi:hypothetical protein
LHRFALAIESNALLSPESTEIFLTGKVDMAPNRSYAYGFGDHREAGHRYHGHNGGAPGINADFRFYPFSGYTYVVLANMDGAAMPVSRLIHEMIVRQGSSLETLGAEWAYNLIGRVRPVPPGKSTFPGGGWPWKRLN